MKGSGKSPATFADEVPGETFLPPWLAQNLDRWGGLCTKVELVVGNFANAKVGGLTGEGPV